MSTVIHATVFATIVSALIAVTPKAMADLADGAKASVAYQQVSVSEYLGEKATYKYKPQTRTSAAQYDVKVEVSLKVEGNICAAEPKSLGLLRTFDDVSTYFTLIVMRPGPESMCLQYSKATTIKVPLETTVYEFKGNKTDQHLGVFTYFNHLTGQNGKKELRFQSENGKGAVVAIDL